MAEVMKASKIREKEAGCEKFDDTQTLWQRFALLQRRQGEGGIVSV